MSAFYPALCEDDSFLSCAARLAIGWLFRPLTCTYAILTHVWAVYMGHIVDDAPVYDQLRYVVSEHYERRWLFVLELIVTLFIPFVLLHRRGSDKRAHKVVEYSDEVRANASMRIDTCRL